MLSDKQLVQIRIEDDSPPFTELVVGDGYPDDYHWKSDNQIIHPDNVWSWGRVPEERLRNVNRVRISCIPKALIMQCLKAIESSTKNLSELEIYTFSVFERTTLALNFPLLQCLSIESIVVLDLNEKELPEAQTTNTLVWFDTPMLKTVYLGK